MLDRSIIGPALRDSVVKLDPRAMAKNPVMFVVEVGAVLSTVLLFTGMGTSSASENTFNVIVTVVLWFTVLFANFAEAMAEGRGKAQAASLRATRQETSARRRNADGSISDVASTDLDIGDEVVVVAGEVIPGMPLRVAMLTTSRQFCWVLLSTSLKNGSSMRLARLALVR